MINDLIASNLNILKNALDPRLSNDLSIFSELLSLNPVNMLAPEVSEQSSCQIASSKVRIFPKVVDPLLNFLSFSSDSGISYISLL